MEICWIPFEITNETNVLRLTEAPAAGFERTTNPAGTWLENSEVESPRVSELLVSAFSALA